MILVCPNCDARYTLRPNALGAEGKDVKCAKCAHKWYQRSDELSSPEDEKPKPPKPKKKSKTVVEVVDKIVDKPVEKTGISPIEAALSSADDESIQRASKNVSASLNDDIPNGVKPDAGKDEFKFKPLKSPVGLLAKSTGYAMSLLVAIAILLMLYSFKSQVINIWPPASKIYGLVGYKTPITGKNLTIENVLAKLQKDAQGRDYLSVEGRIVNTTAQVVGLPDLQAQLRSTNGEDGDTWIIKTPLDRLQPNESFSFKSDYANLPRGVGSVNVTFTLDTH